jgi:hypothetical protein
MNVQEIVLPVNSGVAVIGSMTPHLVPGREADRLFLDANSASFNVHLAYRLSPGGFLGTTGSLPSVPSGRQMVAYRRNLRFTVSAAVLT